MIDEPVVWHYGLMAERWAECITDAPEASYFERAIARFGQPALDVGCGAGRVLLPLLQAGIDIDGCDISGDMLAHCRRKAAAEGFSPRLVEQPMHAFDMGRSYRTIYLCDSFDLAGSRERGLETLRRCYEHLEPGGALLLNIEAEYASPESWNIWLAENCRGFPRPWSEEGVRRVAADGSEHIAYFRAIDTNPLEQSYTRQVRLEKRVAGQVVVSEAYTLHGNMYLKNEVVLMLRVAGFREVAVYGDYTDEPAALEHEDLVFTAVK